MQVVRIPDDAPAHHRRRRCRDGGRTGRRDRDSRFGRGGLLDGGLSLLGCRGRFECGHRWPQLRLGLFKQGRGSAIGRLQLHGLGEVLSGFGPLLHQHVTVAPGRPGARRSRRQFDGLRAVPYAFLVTALQMVNTAARDVGLGVLRRQPDGFVGFRNGVPEVARPRQFVGARTQQPCVAGLETAGRAVILGRLRMFALPGVDGGSLDVALKQIRLELERLGEVFLGLGILGELGVKASAAQVGIGRIELQPDGCGVIVDRLFSFARRGIGGGPVRVERWQAQVEILAARIVFDRLARAPGFEVDLGAVTERVEVVGIQLQRRVQVLQRPLGVAHLPERERPLA